MEAACSDEQQSIPDASIHSEKSPKNCKSEADEEEEGEEESYDVIDTCSFKKTNYPLYSTLLSTPAPKNQQAGQDLSDSAHKNSTNLKEHHEPELEVVADTVASDKPKS
jgi:hypothetical protein